MPRAGHWLEEAGGSRSDGSNNVQDLSTMGHVVVGQVTLSHCRENHALGNKHEDGSITCNKTSLVLHLHSQNELPYT